MTTSRGRIKGGERPGRAAAEELNSVSAGREDKVGAGLNRMCGSFLLPRCHDPRGSEVRKSGLVTGSVWMLLFDLLRLHYVTHQLQCKAATSDIFIIN